MTQPFQCKDCKHYTQRHAYVALPHTCFSRLAQDLSHRVRIHSVSKNSPSLHWHSMSHAPSLLYPSHWSSTSFYTCTPVGLSSPLSSRILLMSSSHGNLPCADPPKVSFGPEMHQNDVLPQTEHDVDF